MHLRRKLRLSKTDKQCHVAHYMNHMVHTVRCVMGATHLAGMGDAVFGGGMPGRTRTTHMHYAQEFAARRGVLLVFVDEYRTSHWCVTCSVQQVGERKRGELTCGRVCAKLAGIAEVRCNRDANVTANMVLVLLRAATVNDVNEIRPGLLRRRSVGSGFDNSGGSGGGGGGSGNSGSGGGGGEAEPRGTRGGRGIGRSAGPLSLLRRRRKIARACCRWLFCHPPCACSQPG